MTAVIAETVVAGVVAGAPAGARLFADALVDLVPDCIERYLPPICPEPERFVGAGRCWL